MTAARKIPEKDLDDALAGTFPASDPVALGHSEHSGDPVRGRKPPPEPPRKAA